MQTGHQAAEATTGSAHAGAVFTSATATYIVRIDVERGFFTDPLGEPEIVKQVLRCRRGTSDCALVAQEAGPLQDGDSFTLGTDHRARPAVQGEANAARTAPVPEGRCGVDQGPSRRAALRVQPRTASAVSMTATTSRATRTSQRWVVSPVRTISRSSPRARA